MKWFKKLSFILFLTGSILILFNFKSERLNEENVEAQVEIKETQSYFAILEIEKINLKRELFEIGNINNNVDKNLFVVDSSVFPDALNSNVIIAGHSGSGKNAYFKNLYKLKQGDTLKLYYNNKLYIYEINDIEYQDKTGILYLKKENYNMLTLITCTLNDKKHQTIYYAKLKNVSKIS